MKLYITFGQDHAHHVNGVTFDRDAVAEISCEDYGDGRAIAMDLFGPKFATSYDETQIAECLHFFPRGIFKAN